MSSRPFRVCAAQTDPVLGRPAENAVAVADEIAAAAREGAELVVFPEAALTGYVFESVEEAAEAAVRPDGPELETVGLACREAGAWAVVGGIERAAGGTERADGRGAGEGAPAPRHPDRPALFNAAFLIGPHGLHGTYRKVHTLCLGADRFTRPGDGPFRVWDLPFARVGVHICYDASFPESARALRLGGAQLLVLPTNWPSLSLKDAVVRVRASENHAFYLAVNRVGAERGVRFEGGSRLAAPDGELLLEADAGPGRWHADVDPRRADDSHVVERPGHYEFDRLGDRRPERYGPLLDPVREEGRTGSRRAAE